MPIFMVARYNHVLTRRRGGAETRRQGDRQISLSSYFFAALRLCAKNPSLVTRHWSLVTGHSAMLPEKVRFVTFGRRKCATIVASHGLVVVRHINGGVRR